MEPVSVDVGDIQTRMETDLPISKKVKTENDGEKFMELPSDYSNWSSTVIIFKENKEDVGVYAFDCDECIVYYVVSYKRMSDLYKLMGYTAGDSKVYFVGDAIVDENVIYSCEVKVYDIPSRQWKQNFPKLSSPKIAPFVFFFEEKLYVLSFSWVSEQFEVLDINNKSQGWVTLSGPSNFAPSILACQNSMIIDSSMKMLYIRDYDSMLYCYNLHDDKWHIYDLDNPLSTRTCNLWESSWISSGIIVENYLYRFQMLRFGGHIDDDHVDPGDLQAFLIVRDLDHEIKIYNDSAVCTPGLFEVDISHVVDGVMLDPYAFGHLVYLGNWNSCLRFSLVILYHCKSGSNSCSGEYHVCTCTFDLRRKSKNLSEESTARESSAESFIANRLCCKSFHVKMGPLTCNKLCM